MRILAMTLCASANALAAEPDPPSSQLYVDHLPNGLTTYVQADRTHPGRAELRLALKVGSLAEGDDQIGAAHLVEHLALRGVSGNENLVEQLSRHGVRIGPDLNGKTTADETVYRLTVPTADPEALDLGLRLLHDWAAGPREQAASCDMERGVVIEEWRTHRAPTRQAEELLSHLLTEGSRYAARPPEGTEASLRELACAHVRRFIDVWYRPDLEAVVVVGDVNAMEIRGKLASRFSDLSIPLVRLEPPAERVSTFERPRVAVFSDATLPGTTIEVARVVDALVGDDPRSERLGLVDLIVRRIVRDRLAMTLERESSGFVRVDTAVLAVTPSQDAEVARVHTTTVSPMEASRRLLVELERLRRFGITEAELARAKRNVRSESEPSVSQYAEAEPVDPTRVAVSDFLHDWTSTSATYRHDTADTVTVTEALGRLRARWFNGQPAIAVSMNAASGTPLTTESLMVIVDEVAGAELEPLPSEEAKPFVPRVQLAPGPAIQVDEDPVSGITKCRLDNGLTLYLKPTGTEDGQVVARAFSPGGSSRLANETISRDLPALVVGLQSGFDVDGSNEGGHEVEISLEASRGFDLVTLETDGSVESAISAFAFVARHARFTKAGLEATRRLIAEEIRRKEVDPDAAFDAAMRDSRWVEGTERARVTRAGIEALDLATAESVYREDFASLEDWTLVVVGGFRPEEAILEARRWLSPLANEGPPTHWRDDGARLTDVRRTVDSSRGHSPLSRVRLLFESDAPVDPNEAALLDGLADLLRTRLRTRLRVEQQGVYASSVHWTYEAVPTPVVEIRVQFECDPGRLDALRRIAWEVVDELRASTADADLVSAIREQRRVARARALDDLNGAMEEIAAPLQFGWDLGDALSGWRVRIDSITPISLREAAVRRLDLQRVVEGIQRP